MSHYQDYQAFEHRFLVFLMCNFCWVLLDSRTTIRLENLTVGGAFGVQDLAVWMSDPSQVSTKEFSKYDIDPERTPES